VVVAHSSLRGVYRAAPGRYRALSATIVAATLAGHLAGDGEATYPFVDWDMYTEPVQGDATYFQLSMVRAAGLEERVPIEALFRGATVMLRVRVWRLAGEIHELPDGAERGAAAERLTAVLSAIAARYNQTHPEDPIQALRLARCVVPLDPDGGVGAAECHPFWDVEGTER
jgi:hypothetical protein